MAETLTDIISKWGQESNPSDIDKNLKKYDVIVDEDFQDEQFNRKFSEGEDRLHDTFKKSLETKIGNDKTSLQNKKDELQHVIVQALTEYFKVVDPTIISPKVMAGAWNTEDKYRFLASQYDRVTGADPRKGEGFSNYAEMIAKTETKEGRLKRSLYARKAQNASKGLEVLTDKAKEIFVRSIPSHLLATHIKPSVEKDYTIKKMVDYVMNDQDTLLNIRQGVKKGKWGESGYEAYGLGKK